MSDKKQVKVDNWGIYFLQRLKHFFNRTDYCDLTLQFQDNAQLKVHRLVLNACTEYFELLERTCEMYEDCLIMPEDLQADVVVPIVNFMYTGQLEFKQDLLEKLYHTSEIMNIPVLTKLLAAQRGKPKPAVSYGYSNKGKRPLQNAYEYKKSAVPAEKRPRIIAATPPVDIAPKPQPTKEKIIKSFYDVPTVPVAQPQRIFAEAKALKQEIFTESKPTRYEVPEDLVSDTMYDDSFSNISYESRPLMVHPETSKRYGKKMDFGIFSETASTSLSKNNSTINIVESSSRVSHQQDALFEDEFLPAFEKPQKSVVKRNANQLFDQMLEDGASPNITIEGSDPRQPTNIDHAKIISEVMKKYPHLIKSNKNFKLKIVETPGNHQKPINRRQSSHSRIIKPEPEAEMDDEEDQEFYESEVLDSKEAARLIALGAENVFGPWICLICGTPGKALHFTTYLHFRRHLVEVHKEKPILNICEYCGHKSNKRNYLLHHMYTKHQVTPPKAYKFPKCPECDYVGLSAKLLAKHKSVSHSKSEQMPCTVCFKWFPSPQSLLKHMQTTGHKVSSGKKTARCMYCPSMFKNDAQLYAHIKSVHRRAAANDNILEDSDEETKPFIFKREAETVQTTFSDNDSGDIQFTIEQNYDGSSNVVVTSPQKTSKQKILNTQIQSEPWAAEPAPVNDERSFNRTLNSDFLEEEETITPNAIENQIIIRNDEFIQTSQSNTNQFYIGSQSVNQNTNQTQSGLQNIMKTEKIMTNKIITKPSNINQPIQIVVSNPEEYKKLMASNQSIIIDSEGATKTLAVLTTPQTDSIATTSVDTSQSQANDMIILPDDYQLNDTEATVATSSGNIMVVYSHELEDANKQFVVNPSYAQSQPQSSTIDAEIIPSTTVMASNFVTSTSGGHVVIPNTIVTWQNNIGTITQQANSGELITIEQLQSAGGQIVPNEAGQTNNLVELSEMQYVTTNESAEDDSHQVAPSNGEVPATNEASEINTQEAMETSQENETDDMEEEAEEYLMPTPTAQTETIIATSEIEEENANAGTNESQEVDHHESRDPAETDINECKENENQQNADIQSEKSAEDVDRPDKMESSNVVKNSTGHIRNLASEWTEDEDEAEGDTETTDAETSERNKTVQESIESIQQEVEKPVSDNNVENENSDETKNFENHNNTVSDSTSNNEPPEKISNLLTDWDDNESQTENGDKEVDDEACQEPEVSASAAAAVPAVVTKKPDIKNLVNDWDEDEEEEAQI